jgi:hypothetical protein
VTSLQFAVVGVTMIVKKLTMFSSLSEKESYVSLHLSRIFVTSWTARANVSRMSGTLDRVSRRTLVSYHSCEFCDN